MSKKVLYKKINDIIAIYSILLSAKSLAPSMTINSNFARLVNIINKTPKRLSKSIIESEMILRIKDDLRRLSSEGEFELEKFWARKVIRSSNTQKELSQFPYFKNYKNMTDYEMNIIMKSNLESGDKVLFVGSGPLPLSSIMMALKSGVSIDNLDIDRSACSISGKLIQSLKLSHKIKILHDDIYDIVDFSEYQSIFIAALVGKDENDKKNIVRHIAKYAKSETHIVLRSVSGLGALLYPELQTSDFKSIGIVRKHKKPKGVINNAVVIKIK